MRHYRATSILVFSSTILCLIYAFYAVASERATQYPVAQSVKKLCTEKLWPEAIRRTGDFPFASYEGDTLCIAKGIFPNNVEEAISVIKKGKIRNILISSMGGDASSAMDLADQILSMNIDIYVEGPCFSSCANYIFMAGAKKYILEGGVVAWHGAPRAKEDSNQKIRTIAERHLAFFKKIDVEEEITWKFPCDLRNNPQFIESVKASTTDRNVFWTFSETNMMKKFNLKNVIMLWNPKNSKELRENTKFGDVYKSVFLANGCDK